MNTLKDKNFRTRCLAKVLAIAMVVGCLPAASVIGLETEPEKTKEAESTATVLTYTETEDKTVLDKFITDEKTDKSWEKSLTDFKEQLESEGYKDVQEAFDTDDMVYVGGGDAEETEGPTRFVRDGEQESIPLQLYDGEGGEHYLWRYCKADKEVDSEAVEAESEDVEVQNSGTELQTEFFWVRTDKKVNLEKWEETEEVREEDIQESEEVDTYSAEARATAVGSDVIFTVETSDGTILSRLRTSNESSSPNENLLSQAMVYAVRRLQNKDDTEVIIRQWQPYSLKETVAANLKGVLYGIEDGRTFPYDGDGVKYHDTFAVPEGKKITFDGQKNLLSKATNFTGPMISVVMWHHADFEIRDILIDGGGTTKSKDCQRGCLIKIGGKVNMTITGDSVLRNGHAYEGAAVYMGVSESGLSPSIPNQIGDDDPCKGKNKTGVDNGGCITTLNLKGNTRITNCSIDSRDTVNRWHSGIITAFDPNKEIYMTDNAVIDNCTTYTITEKLGGTANYTGIISMISRNCAFQMDGNAEIKNNILNGTFPKGSSFAAGSTTLAVSDCHVIAMGDPASLVEIGGNAKITGNKIPDSKIASVINVTSKSTIRIKDKAEISGNSVRTAISVGTLYSPLNSDSSKTYGPTDGKVYLSGSPKIINNMRSGESNMGNVDKRGTSIQVEMTKADFEKYKPINISNLNSDACVVIGVQLGTEYGNTNTTGVTFQQTNGDIFGYATNEDGSAKANAANLKGLATLINAYNSEVYAAAASDDQIQWKVRSLQLNVQNSLLTGDEITDSKNALLVDSKVTASADITALRNSKLYNELIGSKDSKGSTINISTRWTTPSDSKGRYTFAGWYQDAACKTAVDITKISEFTLDDAVFNSLANGTSGDSGTKMVYAKWTPNSFKITYNLDGGNGAGLATSYTYSDNTVKLGTPTKDGYVFEGWYEGNTKVDSIPARAYGDKTYTARWTKAVTDNCPLILDLTNETFTGKDGKDVSGAVSGQIFGSSKIDLNNVDFSAAGCTENHTHTVIVTGKASKSKWIELSGEYDTVVQGVEAFREFRLNTTGKVTFTASADQSINQFTASNSAALTFGANVTTVSIDGTRVITSTSADKAPINGAESKAKVLELSMHEPTSGDTTLKVADVEVSVPGSKRRIAVLDNLNGTWLTGNIKVTTETGKTYVRGFAENDSDSNASDDYSQKNVYGDTFPLGLGSDKNFGRYQEVRLPSNGKQLDVAVPTAVIFNIYTDGSGDNGFVAPEYTLENDSYTYEDKLEVNGQSIMFNKKEVDVDVSYKGIVAVNDSENEYTLREFTKMDQATMAQSEDKPAVCLDMTVNNGKDTVAFPLDETESSSSATVANAVPGANILQLKKPSAYVNDSEKRYYQVPKLIQEQKRRTLEGHHTLSLGFKID